MDQVTIRQLYRDELFIISRDLMAYAFQATPPFPPLEQWSQQPYLTEATVLGLFTGDTPVACAAYGSMLQNVRGTIYPNGGVWGVATHPSARRSGYSRQLIRALLASMHEAATPFSNLYPFRESFYERLGYTTFPQPRIVRIPSASLVPLLQKELKGHVELVSIAEGFSSHRNFLKEQQRRTHGMALSTDHSASSQSTEDTYWLATALVENEPRGMMLYRIESNGDGKDMKVRSFSYTDSAGKYLLLSWLARHVDQVQQIELCLPPSALPETWLSDLRFTLSADEAPMGRIVTIASLDGMQCGPGHFSARIIDPDCPWNNSVYLFEAVDDILHVSEVSTAQCDLTIQGLTALIYGTHEPETFAIRGWGDPSLELQAMMSTMFPPLLPYLYEKY